MSRAFWQHGPLSSADHKRDGEDRTKSRSDITAAGPELLLVEDIVIIAIDFKDRLREAGAGAVTIALKLCQAQEALVNSEYDGAVLDVKLGTDSSFLLAETLLAKDIPVVFVTGYDPFFARPASLRDIPVYEKPVSSMDLSSIVRGFGSLGAHELGIASESQNLFSKSAGTKALSMRSP